MAEKSIKTRVQMKRGTQADWDTATAAGFKPLEGEYIFYSDLNKIKVGKKDANDNLLALDKLDFLDARDADTLDGKHASEFASKSDIPTVNNATLTLNVGGQAVSGNNAFTANDATNTTYNVPSATASAYGVVKVSSVNSSAVTVNSESTTAGRYYPVELNSDGKAIVNVPWTDTNAQDGNDNQKIKGNGTSFGINDEIDIVGSGATTITADTINKKITVSSPAAIKNPNALSIGGKSYDGSSAVSVTAAELRAHLGISNALHFVGLTTTAIADNATTSTITVNGNSHTAVAGDVVLYNDNEYVFDGSKWLELGDGSSHALKSVKINAGAGLTGDGTLASDVTLSVGQGNGITVSDNAVAAKAGNGITVDTNGINHADTSSQASVTASGRKYITGVTLDTYGHVTGLTTGTETVTDTHNSHAVISGKKADGSTDIKSNASSGDITLGDSGVTAGEYGPTANATPGYGATFNVPDIKVNSKGIVTSVVNRTVKIPASDNVDTGATSVEVTGSGNVVTTATYNASTRQLTLIKGATSVNIDTVKTEVSTQINTLISSGTTDPTASTASQYYFKY